ncbi:troponin C, skeletal muscle-like [Rhopilema esculentum]|uniref:troponin C, skeletal muscle-like n=1 Tax=Rhopilema esculentum TaxID=499914 RepID=UPI0031D370BD|eukprot:gene9061-16709_t
MAGVFGSDVPDIVLQSLFKKYDLNHTGYLSSREVRSLLGHDLRMSENEIDAFSLLMDEDGNNSISYEEFKAWIQDEKKSGLLHDPSGTRYQLLLKAVEYFKQFDADDNGALEGQEIVMLMKSIGVREEGIEEAVNSIDKDHNGKISFNEFLKWLQWIPMDDF